MRPSDALIILQARMGSTRFPGKPLCDLLGKSMVQRVYESAVASQVGDDVVVFLRGRRDGSNFGWVGRRGDRPLGLRVIILYASR